MPGSFWLNQLIKPHQYLGLKLSEQRLIKKVYNNRHTYYGCLFILGNLVKRIENKSLIFKCGYLIARMEDDPPHPATSNGEQVIEIEFYKGEWGLSGNIGLWVPSSPKESKNLEEDYWESYGWWSYLSFSCSPEADDENTRIDVFYSNNTFFDCPGHVIKSFVVSNEMLPIFDDFDAENFDDNDFYEYNSDESDESREGVIEAWQFLINVFSKPFGFREFILSDQSQGTDHPDFLLRRFPAKLSVS